MSDKIIHLTDDSFDTDVLKANWRLPSWTSTRTRAPHRNTVSVASRPFCCSKTAKWRRPKWARCPKVSWKSSWTLTWR